MLFFVICVLLWIDCIIYLEDNKMKVKTSILISILLSITTMASHFVLDSSCALVIYEPEMPKSAANLGGH